jgi:ABC-type multidrug transport system fused ATPase/permease subunit
MASLDTRRLQRLLPYLAQDRRRLLFALLLLIPLALAGALQPLLVGQAIAVLRAEPVLPWLKGLAVPQALRVLVGLLLGLEGSTVRSCTLPLFDTRHCQVSFWLVPRTRLAFTITMELAWENSLLATTTSPTIPA